MMCCNPQSMHLGNEEENAELKEYEPFEIKRGQQMQKKIAIPNRGEDLMELTISCEDKLVAINHKNIQVQPGKYGFVRFRFTIPQDFSDNQVKFHVHGRIGELLHKTWVFVINVSD